MLRALRRGRSLRSIALRLGVNHATLARIVERERLYDEALAGMDPLVAEAIRAKARRGGRPPKRKGKRAS